MRLDHLLSREIRVPARGGAGALMALRLIARPIVSPARWEAAAPATASQVDQRPGKTPNPFEHSPRGSLPLFQGQGAARLTIGPELVSGSFCECEAQAPAGV